MLQKNVISARMPLLNGILAIIKPSAFARFPTEHGLLYKMVAQNILRTQMHVIFPIFVRQYLDLTKKRKAEVELNGENNFQHFMKELIKWWKKVLPLMILLMIIK